MPEAWPLASFSSRSASLLARRRAAAAEESAAAAASAPQTAWAYQSPRTLPSLLQLLAAHPKAQLVAGCTDVGLWITKQHRQFAQIIDLTQVQELRRLDAQPQHLLIGAAVTLADAFEALVKERPELHSFATRFAGLPVRNSGTLGGNVANGSPIGDSMPLLIALGAQVVLMAWRKGKIVHRHVPLDQFYTGYRQSLLATDCSYGCPIGILALELHEPDPQVQQKLAANFAKWTAAIESCLRDAVGRATWPAMRSRRRSMPDGRRRR